MWQTIAIAALEFLKSIFVFGEKVAPDIEIRKVHLEENEVKRIGRISIAIYDKSYIRLKTHTEIDISTDINAHYPMMPESQKFALVTLLSDRIYKHRCRHKVIYKKWITVNWEMLKEKGYI